MAKHKKDEPEQSQAFGDEPVGLRDPNDPTLPLDKGDDILQEQPAAEPKDQTREEAGDWSTPPPHQPPPSERAVKGVPRELADPQRIPRVIDQNMRAGKGFKRYKIRADVVGMNYKTLYILAKEGDMKGAEECYIKALGLDRKRKVVDEKGDIKEVAVPVDLVSKELPD